MVVLRLCGLKLAFIENIEEGMSYHLIETTYSSVLLMQHLDYGNEFSGSCFWILTLFDEFLHQTSEAKFKVVQGGFIQLKEKVHKEW